MILVSKLDLDLDQLQKLHLVRLENLIVVLGYDSLKLRTCLKGDIEGRLLTILILLLVQNHGDNWLDVIRCQMTMSL